MSGEMQRLGRTIRAAEHKGPARYVNGITASAPASGRIDVDVPAGRRPAVIPGSFRAALASGQNVRLSVVGDVYTIDSVLSALPTPTVAAPPSAVSGSTSTAYGANSMTVGSTYDQADLNSIFDHIQTVIGDLASRVNSLKARVDAIQPATNAVATTAGATRTALINQGHIQ